MLTIQSEPCVLRHEEKRDVREVGPEGGQTGKRNMGRSDQGGGLPEEVSDWLQNVKVRK